MGHRKVGDILSLWGLLNVISPLPLMLFTSLFSLAVLVCSGFDTESSIVLIIGTLPVLIHPVSCIAGFVFALRHRAVRKKEALACMCLSAAAMTENILLWLGLAHLASVG